MMKTISNNLYKFSRNQSALKCKSNIILLCILNCQNGKRRCKLQENLKVQPILVRKKKGEFCEAPNCEFEPEIHKVTILYVFEFIIIQF